jgi:VWFA-related protein
MYVTFADASEHPPDQVQIGNRPARHHPFEQFSLVHTPAKTFRAHSKGSTMQTRRTTNPFVSIPVAFSMLLLAAVTAGSQAQIANFASPAPSPSADTPSTGSHRVSIDVEVTDKLGHHIDGLQSQDFTLLDNKQPARIVDVRDVDSRNLAADPVHVVIVVDMINAGFDVVARERQQLGEFLKQDGGRLAHPTSLAMLTEKGIQIQKNSTADGNALAASLDSSSSGLRMEGKTAGFYGAADRMQWSLGQLGELAAYEATQPGRKLAFFISPGWPMLAWAGLDATTKERQWTFNSIVELTNGLRQARVVLYAIDPFELGRTDPFYYQNYLKGVSKVNDAEYADLGLQVLAAHTGGLVQVTGMDIKGEINDAIRDATAYYTLTFEAPTPDRPNEYHDLHLQLDKPGVTVRTTSGYYANTQALAQR